MIRHTRHATLFVASILLLSTPIRGQNEAAPSETVMTEAPPMQDVDWSFAQTYGAPGRFGMAYGTPGFGLARTYSSYSSSYGPGYAYGYAPSGFIPNRYGLGLWRPNEVPDHYITGAGYYRTIPIPNHSPAAGPVPPVGAYAPFFGPTPPGSWDKPVSRPVLLDR